MCVISHEWLSHIIAPLSHMCVVFLRMVVTYDCIFVTHVFRFVHMVVTYDCLIGTHVCHFLHMIVQYRCMIAHMFVAYICHICLSRIIDTHVF